jgi:threonine/homoserine/homoserine lactone efflux protein
VISLQFLVTAIVVCATPGTGVIYTLALGLGQGRRATIAATVGCTIGIVPHLAAATLELAALLHTSAVLLQVVKFTGVAYLLYLAWQALKSDGALSISPDAMPQHAFKIARRGALINILNPKLSIFFLALLPPFLTGDPATVTTEMILMGGIFMALTFVIFVLYGVFAAFARTWLLQSKTVMTWLNRSFAGIFTALSLRLAFEKA